MPDSSGIEELPPLSDEDINILFQIVSDAQQSPDPPFRALFAAYDRILASHGIAPEHDQRFFRYLLRLGEGNGHNTRTLMSKLRRLLTKLGITIVVQDDDEVATHEEEQGFEDHVRPTEEFGTGSTRRRASFNDTQLDETWLEQERLRVPVSSNADPSARGRVIAQQPSHPRRSRSLSNQGSLRVTQPPPREPLAHHNPFPYHQDAVTDDSQSDIPSSPPVLPSQHRRESQDTEMGSEVDAFLYTSQIKAARECLRKWQYESSRMTNMAHIAQSHDQRLLKTQAFGIWTAKLLEKRQTAETERFFDHYERRATRARDLFLLNKAFTHWAQTTSDEVARTSVARRHILRTRYFNAWRDITAVNDLKCRRLGLRKWFSVWRANTARKAIDSERAVAVYEENLVQRVYWKWFWNFCERKAPIWHDYRVRSTCLRRMTGALTQNRQNDAAASRMRNNNLLRKTFRNLIARRDTLQSLEQAADQRRRMKLLSNCLHQIHQESKLGNASRQLSTTVERHLLTTTVAVWQRNTQLSQQATAVDRRRLLQNAWTNWNDLLRTRALTSRIDDRIILENLYKWVLQSRLSLFRRVMDSRLQERVLQTLSSRLSQHRFRLEEASMIFKEHQRRRILASVMLRFHGKSRTEEMMERQALEFRNAHALNAIVPIWTQKTQHLQKLNRWSDDARYYCLTTAAIRKWKEATTQAKRNKRRDAYVQVRLRVKSRIVRDSLNTWREKTVTVRDFDNFAGERAHARRVSASTAVFGQWRGKARSIIGLSLQADDFRARVLFLRAISALTIKGQEVVAHHSQAIALHSQSVDLIATEMLKKLKWTLFCHRRSQDSAAALERRNAQQHRRNMLRYWAEQATRRRALRTLPLPQQEDVPESPTRFPPPAPVSAPASNLFSSMRLPSARKTPAPQVPPTPLAPLVDGDEDVSDAEMDFGATQRAEEWTNFDVMRDFMRRDTNPPLQPPLQQFNVTTTPLPGYMTRTPSKRTARAKARSDVLSAVSAAQPTRPTREVLITTTPAPTRPAQNGPSMTPQVTPFERKMRAGGYGGVGEGSTTPATFRRTRFGGSAPQFGRSFAGVNGLATGRSVRFFDVQGNGGDGENDVLEEVDE